VKEIQSAIAEALKNNASKMELKSLEDRLMESINNRANDTEGADKLFSKFQTEMEKMKAEFAEQSKKATFAAQAKKETFGDFLVKARRGDAELREMTRKALGESTGVDGGFLVPEQFSNEIAQVRLERSVVRGSGARVINMNSNILRIPALNVSSNAAGSIFGGVAAYWTGEAETKTPSAPKFKQITLEAQKLIGYVESSDELDNDAITSMGGLLQDLFVQTIAFEEDAAFLTGNGVGKPLGILNAPATIAVTRTTASKVGTEDLVEMIARSYGALSNKVWIVNQSVLPEIYKLKDANSNYILLPGSNSNIAGALPQTIYGVPVIVSEKLPALGTSGDIMLADMSYYLIGDRQQITVDESIHVKFQTDEKSWRFVTRVAGQPWLDSAITPRAGGVTLSPFVKLT
jgi:HK97 family phage major capsid protein